MSSAQPFDCRDWQEAFALCRDKNVPITAAVTTRENNTITVNVQRVFPSGYAKHVRTETTYFLDAQYAQKNGGPS